MKFNLKNRPVKSTPQAYEDFLKGMEEELRQIRADNSNKGEFWSGAKEWLISAILGE